MQGSFRSDFSPIEKKNMSAVEPYMVRTDKRTATQPGQEFQPLNVKGGLDGFESLVPLQDLSMSAPEMQTHRLTSKNVPMLSKQPKTS